MSKRKIILYSILIVIIIASYEYVLVPLQKQSDEINKELHTKFDNRSRYARNQIVVKRAKELHDEYAGEISELLRQENLVPDVHQEIAKQLGVAGLDMVQIDELPEVRKDRIRTLSFAVKATGEYAQMLKLLDEVLLLPRLINVHTLNVESFADGTKEQDKLKLDMVLEYYSVKENIHPPLSVEYGEESAQPAQQDA